MTEIIEQLNNEKNLYQTHRYNYISKKIAFIVSLFGLSSLNINTVSFYEVLYLIPFISLGFDIYILNEDFKIKRIGEFLKINESISTKWENWVVKYKNPYASIAAFGFTMITIIGSTILIFKRNSIETLYDWVFWLWLIIALIINFTLLYYSKRTRNYFK